MQRTARLHEASLDRAAFRPVTHLLHKHVDDVYDLERERYDEEVEECSLLSSSDGQQVHNILSL